MLMLYILGGNFNSTKLQNSYDNFVPDSQLPGQKREPYWWASVSATQKAAKVEWDMQNLDNEKYLEDEYSTFNPDESQETNSSLNQSQLGGFPIPLNPSFDLQALVWVRNIITYTVYTVFLQNFSMAPHSELPIMMTSAQSE